MAQLENGPQNKPKVQGPEPLKIPPVKKEESLVAEDKFITDYDKESHTKFAKYHEHALKTIFALDPKLAEVYGREGLRFFVTDDVQKTAMLVGKPVMPGLDAATITVAVAKGGDVNNAQAKGTFVILSADVYSNYSRLVATLLHELRHCQQSINPGVGQKIRPISEAEAERDAYGKEIQDLKKLRDTWAKQAKTDEKMQKFVAEMDEVIRREEALHKQWLKR